MTLNQCTSLLSVALLFIPVTCQAEGLRYDKPVVLEGKFVTGRADAETTFDEKPHSFAALRLSKPISTTCAAGDDECSPETGVDLLQLVLDEAEMSKFDKLEGTPVKVKGTLFHSDNGHHFTSVLLDVEAIEK